MARNLFKAVSVLFLSLVLGTCGGGDGGNSGGGSSAPVVSVTAAASITETGATLNGLVNPNGLATQAWFEWGTDPTLSAFTATTQQSVGEGTTATAVSQAVSGLTGGTTYYCRICGSNAQGTTRSTIASFTTGSPGSAPTVSTLAATSVSATGATLNGSVNPNGLATEAWFEWGTDAALTTSSSTAVQSSGSGATSVLVSASLSGLATGTTTYYRVAASNGTGTSRGVIAAFLPAAGGTVQMGGSIQGAPLSLAGATLTSAGSTLIGSKDGAGTAARFYSPAGIATDGTNLFVADTGNHTIRRVVIATGEVTTLAGAAGTSGASDGTGTAARFNAPSGLATDGTNLFVADTGNHTIRRIVIATGEVATLAGAAGTSGASDGTGTAARFNAPSGLATDGTNLFVADTENHAIRKIVIATGAVTSLAGAPTFWGTSDGTGTAARFHSPSGLATDGTSLYVADTGNHTVRKVVIASGEVSTLAGQPTYPGSYDGVGTAARFINPQGITTDGTNLFVADTGNHTIRKVVIAAAEATTLAGSAGSSGSADGAGTAARFINPQGVTTDGTSLYVADTGNHAIRKVVIATAEATTLAGSAGSSGSADGAGTAARFSAPAGVTTDGTNLFVADSGNHAIRRIVIATGEVTTLAGSAGSSGSSDGTGTAARFNGPHGITTDGTNLFVADTSNHTIRKVVIATGEVTTLAGSAGLADFRNGTGASARFFSPHGITTDGTNLFVADTQNHLVRRVLIATGEVTFLAGMPTVAGSSDGTGQAAMFDHPGGITTDGTNLFVADTDNYTIRQVVISTNAVTTLAGSADSAGSSDGSGTAARFYSPSGITTDGTSLFVADTGNHAIRQVSIATGAVTTPAGSAGSAGSSDGSGTAARFYSPSGITTDGASLFVADTSNNTIRKIQ